MEAAGGLFKESPRSDLGEDSMMSSQEQRDIELDHQQDRNQQVSQQSSCVHTDPPDQSQVEVQNLSIGNRSAVFLGPVNQAVIQNVTGTPDPEQVQAAAGKAKDALKNKYTTTGSYVQMLPWVDDEKKHIMDIYTKLSLVEQVVKRGGIQKTETKNMKSYEEMFHYKTRENNQIKRVVISGSAGIGKTTLIDKIAYDWALGSSETLNKYELVLVLKMRSLKQSSNLMDAIFNHLLGKDSVNQSALKEFIDNNQDKVLILLDGFDEFQITTCTLDTSSFGSILEILNRKQGTECWVFITSRPPLDKLVNSSLVEKPYIHVTVEGFSIMDIRNYVEKFFPHKDYQKGQTLIQQIKLSDTLFDLAKSPMLLLLICLLWDAENTLPDTMTRLYNKTLNYIFKRKTRDIKEDEISKILIAIGKVALDHLISKDQSFAFREGDFQQQQSAFDAAMNAGVLTSERVIDGLDTYQSVSFIHLTFLEYCAAMYWQSLINTEEFDKILDKIHVESMRLHPLSLFHEYLIRFCCGDNETCTNHILQKVHQDKISRLAIICYFESQSRELPTENVISSVLTDINISNWNDDSTKAFIYFLKRVTALRGENDYFKKVKTLVAASFNFQRFGEDLAGSLKLMNNIHSLSLKDSSLTTANTKVILSSLASPSTLAELDLSYNTITLGSSLSELAPQLMELKHLQKLSLVQCLHADCVSTIVESVGDTLVDLNVSWNKTFCGSASQWAPLLTQMKCLQNIDFSYCFMGFQDIVNILRALSEVSTLVNLILSVNGDLGGNADYWANNLRRLRHLKKVIFCDCDLQNRDVEPIARALSRNRTLVHLDLSHNDKLGGCASLWAPHLKDMDKLKELILASCHLKNNDMNHIAESVSTMHGLVYLDLSQNKAAVGCELSWMPHLKNMTENRCELKVDELRHEALVREGNHFCEGCAPDAGSPIMGKRL